MFFVYTAINLIFWITSGYYLYQGNYLYGFVFGMLSLAMTFLIIHFYKKRPKQQNNDWVNADVYEVFNFRRFDCVDMECGKLDLFDCGKRGTDCDGWN